MARDLGETPSLRSRFAPLLAWWYRRIVVQDHMMLTPILRHKFEMALSAAIALILAVGIFPNLDALGRLANNNGSGPSLQLSIGGQSNGGSSHGGGPPPMPAAPGGVSGTTPSPATSGQGLPALPALPAPPPPPSIPGATPST
ncbi:MAG TPA: hypothetical protein VG015_02450 [Candidatus Dormibacteraeota bacterium]|nr:hypothetical protein [Candidatus Dormibacteraeota bacterium]